MLMVSVALVMAVIVTNIYLRKNSTSRIPTWVRNIFIGRSATKRHHRSTVSRNSKYVESKYNDEPSNHGHNNHNDIGGLELDHLSLQSEQEQTLTCRHKSCPRTREASFVIPDEETRARIAYEWETLAECVDRIFFWLFLAASIGALTTMYMQIPHYS